MTTPPKRWLEAGLEDAELRALMQRGADELAPRAVMERSAQRLGKELGVIMTAEAASLAKLTPEASTLSAPAPVSAFTGALKTGVSALLVAATLLGVRQIAITVQTPTQPAVPRVERPADDETSRAARSPRAVAVQARASERAAAPDQAASASQRPAAAASRVARPSVRGAAPIAPPGPPGAAAAAPDAPGSSAAVVPRNTRLEELRQLEQARRELSGDPRRALAALRAHAARFPASWLAQERDVLTVHALIASGQRAAARAAVESLQARYPESPHAQDLRRALK